MLSNRHSRACYHQGTGRANVERPRPVPAGPASVQQIPVHFWTNSAAIVTHHLSHRGDFFNSLSFRLQSDQECGRLGRGSFPRHYLPHRHPRLIQAQIIVFQENWNDLSDHCHPSSPSVIVKVRLCRNRQRPIQHMLSENSTVIGLLQIVQSRYPITVSSLPKELDTYALFSTCVTIFVRVRFQNEYRQVRARTRSPSGDLRTLAPSNIRMASRVSTPSWTTASKALTMAAGL